MHRRKFLTAAPLAAAGWGVGEQLAAQVDHLASADAARLPGEGIPIHQQSVSQWCYGYLPLEELLPKLRAIGLSAIDLIAPHQWHVLQEHGFTCSMAYGREQEDITTGFIDEDKHDELVTAYTQSIPLAASFGIKSMVCFAGNRRGRNDLEGLRIAAKGLKRLMPIAAAHGITLHLEVFNSKVDHPDYMGDSSAWAIALVDMVDSENFKILYDIYHMAVQEGNIIATIHKYHQYFGHYHTAGVPGRHELNQEQELYYPAIMRAIRASGFTGYVAHEFIPTYDDRLAGLHEAVRICS